MITRLTHGLNAAIFGSFVYMATSFGPATPSLSTSVPSNGITTRAVATQPVSPVRTVTELSSPVRTVSERPTPVNPVRTVTELAPAPAASAKTAPAASAATIPEAPVARVPGAPRLFSPSSPLIPLASNGAPYLAVPPAKLAEKPADPIIPPIARKRPGESSVAAAERKAKQKQPTTSVAADQNAKPDPQARTKPAGATTVAAAPKRDIDLSGRSALGAPLPPSPRCAADQKFDVKALKCVKAPAAQAKAKAER